MHVGWSLLVGLHCARAVRAPWLRTAALAHPVLMTVTVVATGNHYLLDAAAGVAVVGLAALLLRVRALPRALPSPAVLAAVAGPLGRSDHARR